MATIAVLGTLDSKGEEHAFVAALIAQHGHQTLLIDVGTGGPATVQPDITREQVAAAIGLDLASLIAKKDRGVCVVAMTHAAPAFVSKLAADGRIHGIISLGGGGGTAIGTAAMRALPLGFPKLMVSTLAAGNIAPYLGTKDIMMMPSIADVAGLNRLSRVIFTRAAGAICGMVGVTPEVGAAKPLIVASQFGNTTTCVTEAKKVLEAAGYEVLVFAATGTGGRIMESIIESGIVAGVLDLTTTEWADELVGGVLNGGPERMDAAAKANIPVVVAPGCLDMVNFGEMASIPEKFKGRNFYIHNPQITLMRTTADECRQLGEIIANKANSYRAGTAIMIPRKAISVISAPGQPFHDSAADEALFTALKSNAKVPVQEFDLAINDKEFAQACAYKLIELIGCRS
ncbi:MAG: Tm-1-like ATP-binding domain-containing protein [Verrucomicrobia bacterium]|nr:Tm-1-like ATP-binding domain-containing protein [Verrucomicrobiota bacterium]